MNRRARTAIKVSSRWARRSDAGKPYRGSSSWRKSRKSRRQARALKCPAKWYAKGGSPYRW